MQRRNQYPMPKKYVFNSRVTADVYMFTYMLKLSTRYKRIVNIYHNFLYHSLQLVRFTKSYTGVKCVTRRNPEVLRYPLFIRNKTQLIFFYRQPVVIIANISSVLIA